jgi:hypothetical protein
VNKISAPVFDEKLRELVQLLDDNSYSGSAADLLGRYLSDSYTLSNFERLAVREVIDINNEFSDEFVTWFAHKLFDRANEIGDSLED